MKIITRKEKAFTSENLVTQKLNYCAVKNSDLQRTSYRGGWLTVLWITE